MKKNKTKIGNIVQIISGKYKGQKGKVTKILTKKQCLCIENINIKIKHIKPQKTQEQGSIKKMEAPVHISNIKILTDNSK